MIKTEQNAGLEISNASFEAHRDCEVTTRLAKKKDLPALARLEKVIYANQGPWGLNAYQEDFSKEGRYYLVCFCEQTLIGYACASIAGFGGEVTAVTVDANHRRRGLARMLMEELITWCESNAVCVMVLQLRSENKSAMALYKSLGFVRHRSIKDYYGTGTCGIEMRKNI